MPDWMKFDVDLYLWEWAGFRCVVRRLDNGWEWFALDKYNASGLDSGVCDDLKTAQSYAVAACDRWIEASEGWLE
jgi:hypothetical protein